MKLILVASMAFAAYFVSSADFTSMTMTFSRLRVNGSYSARSSSVTRGLSAPTTTRSGRMKSSMAAPSLRNSGFDTTSNSTSALRFVSDSATAAPTLSPVPTGTVDLVTTTLYSVMCSPIERATASTYLRSAEPSSSGGVPTAMSCSWPWATPSAAEVVNRRRSASALVLISASRPGSWMGISPRLRPSIFLASTSTQSTSLPASARHAPVTRPT